MRTNASGARYSFIPRRPTVGPSSGTQVNRATSVPPRPPNLGKPGEPRKVQNAQDRRAMSPLRHTLGAVALAAVALCRSASAQTVHVVRLEVDPAEDIHRFVPARVTAKVGDVIRFRVVSGAP